MSGPACAESSPPSPPPGYSLTAHLRQFLGVEALSGLVLLGALASAKLATLPLRAALGGVMLPALISIGSIPNPPRAVAGR